MFAALSELVLFSWSSSRHLGLGGLSSRVFRLVFLALSCFVLFASPGLCQYGFGFEDDSFYDNPNFTSPLTEPNPYNTFANATWAEEKMEAFKSPILSPTVVYVRDDLWSSGVSGAHAYERYDLSGYGPFWKIVSGQPALYIDLRELKSSPTRKELDSMGVVFESNNTVTFSLTYWSEIDEPEVVHAHGILGRWWTDGVPYLNTPTISRDQHLTLAYNINPATNSGTYFLHSHYGFNAIHGAAVPLIIQAKVDKSHVRENVLNQDIQELLFYAEDWCLLFTNADDAFDGHGDNFTNNFKEIRDPYICQNPYLTFRALYGEWNSFKGKSFLKPPGQGLLNQCMMEPSPAPEFGSSFFLVNDRTYNDAHMEQVGAGSYARLRVINAARMSNFLLRVPSKLEPIIIAVDGSYVQDVEMRPSMCNEDGCHMWVGIAQRVDILLHIPIQPDSFAILAIQEMPDITVSNATAFAPFQKSLVAGLILYSTATPPVDKKLPETVDGTGMLSAHPEWIWEQEMRFKPWPPSETLDITNAKQVQMQLTGYNGIFGANFRRGLQFPPTIDMDSFLKLVDSLQPLVDVQYRDIVCINMTNFSWDTHPMHLHGHHFQVRSYDGRNFSGAIRDTVLVPAGKCHSVNICFQANQPDGQFGLHCHMAIHEMAGMFGVIRYGKGVPLVGIPQDSSGDSQTDSGRVVGVSVGLTLGLLLLFSALLNGYLIYKRSHPDHVPYEAVSMGIAQRPSVMGLVPTHGRPNSARQEELPMVDMNNHEDG